MHALLAHYFRMKRDAHGITLANADDATIRQFRDDLNAFTDRLDNRRTDERRMDWLIDTGHGQIDFKRIILIAKGIASNHCVDATEWFLPAGLVFDLVAEQNQSGAGAKHWQTIGNRLLDRFVQFEDFAQLVYGGRFAAWQNETVD